MFVHRKKNRFGSTGVVVINKYGVKFKELHTAGIGQSGDEIFTLCEKEHQWIKNYLAFRNGILRNRKTETEKKRLLITLIGNIVFSIFSSSLVKNAIFTPFDFFHNKKI